MEKTPDTPLLRLKQKWKKLNGLKELLLLVQKHKQNIFGYFTDFILQLGNLAKRFFSNILQLRLRVNESLLERIYCKLWFANIAESSEHINDREAFSLLVSQDVKSYPQLDEEFIQLSPTFVDGMITEKDSSEIVPETVLKGFIEIFKKMLINEN